MAAELGDMILKLKPFIHSKRGSGIGIIDPGPDPLFSLLPIDGLSRFTSYLLKISGRDSTITCLIQRCDSSCSAIKDIGKVVHSSRNGGW